MGFFSCYFRIKELIIIIFEIVKNINHENSNKYDYFCDIHLA